jgi:hypothetical protein
MNAEYYKLVILRQAKSLAHDRMGIFRGSGNIGGALRRSVSGCPVKLFFA